MLNNMQTKPSIVFFGTPEFSVRILEKMQKAGFFPSLIITAPDKPQGRRMKLSSPPVKVWGQNNKIEVSQPEKLDERIVKKLRSGKYNLFIVASYGKIIPKEILDIPRYGALNVHPSLLPRHRGPSPVQSAILEGDKRTGVTIMLLDEEMDHGPILKISNLLGRAGKSQISSLTYKELESRLANLGGEILVETIPNWVRGKIKPIPQNHGKATYTKKITKKDALIDWNEFPEVIERKIRAFTPSPGAHFFLEKSGRPFRVIITKARVQDNKLVIEKIKPEGKNEMDLKDFLKGNPEFNQPTGGPNPF
jgi:methionyl-tRNA formyltransferase